MNQTATNDHHLPLKKRKAKDIIPFMDTTTAATILTPAPALPLLNKQQPKKKKKKDRQHLRFNNIVHVAPISKVSKEQATERWYNDQELKTFKSKGRAMSSLYRKVIKVTSGNITDRPSQQEEVFSAKDLSQFRGFEDYTLRRQRQKLMANRCVLYAQTQGMTETEIATVYNKANRWSKDVAFVQAIHDHIMVYKTPEYYRNQLPVLPLVHQMIPPSLFPFGIASFNAMRKKHNKRTLRSVSSSTTARPSTPVLSLVNKAAVGSIGNNDSSRRVRRRKLSIEHTLQ